MPLWDIADLMVGISYKGRQDWERTRTAAYIAIAPHCKKIDKNKMLPFPWDEKPDTSISNKDIDRMKQLAKKFEGK